MEKEFVPYEQALALKELGFEEECLDFYDDNKELFYNHENKEKIHIGDSVKAPLYQQAFRWFRDTYNLDGSMSVDVWNKKTTSYRITGGIKGIIEADSYGALYDIDSKDYDSYEEAQIECLKQLIEIVKQKLVQSN